MPAGDDGAGGVAFAQHSFFGAPAEKVFVLLSSARLLAPADRTLIEEPECPKSTRNSFRCSTMYYDAMRAKGNFPRQSKRCSKDYDACLPYIPITLAAPSPKGRANPNGKPTPNSRAPTQRAPTP